MYRLVGSVLAVAALGIALVGCSGDDTSSGPSADGASAQSPGGKLTAAPLCPPGWKAGWQRLADRVDAAVYCPSWLPAPLTGEIDGEWNGSQAVERDRSYLMGFIWFERGSGEVHVNFRGYPGRVDIPQCNGRPCFNDPQGEKQVGHLRVQVYTVNRGTDTWHLLYAWEREGSLYTVSQHVVPALGLTIARVERNLDRIVRGLALIEPSQP
jgi:hypothetical protein